MIAKEFVPVPGIKAFVIMKFAIRVRTIRPREMLECETLLKWGGGEP
jgi:hypothetical protein